MTKTVVVTRYNENLDWLAKLDTKINKFIINKGESINSPYTNVIRPNIGYESESWLWYMFQYYDDLSDITYFLQGNPFDHVKLKDLQLILKNNDISFAPISKKSSSCNPLGATEFPKGKQYLLKIWENMFNSAPPAKWDFAWGGQFAVSKDLIKKRSKEFYENSIKLIETKEDACALERAWQFIFS
jgi:hypothetical protein